jgi:hypothetical protein
MARGEPDCFFTAAAIVALLSNMDVWKNEDCAVVITDDQLTGREQLAPGGRKDASYEYSQRHPDDKEAVEGQGSIAIHGLEHLVTSDRGVVLFRKILREAIRAVTEGRDPKGIIRSPERAMCIPTSAGSVVS